MKRLRAMKASKKRKEYLNKIQTRESNVLETLSAIHSSYGKNTESNNSRLDYVKSKLFQKTEVNIIK